MLDKEVIWENLEMGKERSLVSKVFSYHITPIAFFYRNWILLVFFATVPLIIIG